MRFEKLKELEESGQISSATTRRELVLLLGYPKGSGRGASWVGNMIRRGYLAEKSRRLDNGSIVKEYSLTGATPDYDSRKRSRTRKRNNARKAREAREQAQRMENATTVGNLVIEKGDLTITVTAGGQELVEIIARVLQK